MKKQSPGAVLTAGTLIIVGTVLTVFFISIRQSAEVSNTSQSVNQTQDVIRNIQRLVMTALDNETGARGYVISGKDNFLDPLYHSNEAFQKEAVLLDSMLQDKPQMLVLLDSMKIYIAKRIHFSDSMVNTRKSKDLNSVIQMVEGGIGKGYTDTIRNIGLRMEAIASARLQERKQMNETNISNLNLLLYSLLGAVTVLSLYTITRIRRDIAQREASEKRFSGLLQAAPDATVIADDKGVIRMINRQTESLFGYTREEMLGQPVELLIPGDLHAAHAHHRNNFMKNASLRPMGAGLELFAVKKDGIQFPVEISLSPIHTDEGLMVIASVRDITTRKKLEADLRRSNAELEAFTYSVSHDLRAPLRGIVGFTTILEEDYGNKFDEEAKRITGIIRSNTLKMGHLIDDLLAFSRLGRQELQKTEVDTASLVAEIIRDLDGQARVSWTIESLPPVFADSKTLRQVWINLLSNAVKYSSKKEAPTITVGHYYNNGEDVFYVKDNGVGFDNKYRDKLFRVFQRLHSEEDFEGTGVGLALVEKIISKHGGRIWAEGVVGEGAGFFFALPNGRVVVGSRQ
jgi:PAS domain S-box-containing protein